jgi:hypothetical protein
MTQPSREEQAVLELNHRMHVEETRGAAGVDFFRDLLDQSLRFRRAGGDIVTREEFLIDLANPLNGRETIEPIGPVSCALFERVAVVTVLLHVVGHNGAKKFDGLFRNIRIFHRETAQPAWRLKMWFNDAVPNPDSA